MEQQNDTLRERLLSRLPQPENLAGYRERKPRPCWRNTQERFAADYFTTNLFVVCAMVVFFVFNRVWSSWRNLNPQALHMLAFIGGMMLLAAVICDIRYRIYNSQVATLKEIKQVQLQVLELQASLQKDRSPRS